MKLQRRVERKIFKAQRERNRMLAINKALIYLRNTLQKSIGTNENDFHLPKIEILKLAKNYISILQHLLCGEELSAEEFMEMLTMNLKNSTNKLLRRILIDQ